MVWFAADLILSVRSTSGSGKATDDCGSAELTVPRIARRLKPFSTLVLQGRLAIWGGGTRQTAAQDTVLGSIAMSRSNPVICTLALCCLLLVTAARADQVTIPYTFTPNTPAVAAEVNANFGAVAAAVNDNASDIAALQSAVAALQATVGNQQSAITALQNTVASQQTTITTLQTDLAAVQANSVLALDGKLTLMTDPATNQPTARFSGVNVQVVNGLDFTDTLNGTGNLIVGYNEDPGSTVFCSLGEFNTDQTTCETNGGIWAANQRSGSHNLIVGEHNAYSSFGGLNAGWHSVVNGYYSSVSGGTYNTASGPYSSVSGGNGNTANSIASSISGGMGNTASGDISSVSGGIYNTARGTSSSVSGGYNNSANGEVSSVSGGYSHPANTNYGWRAGNLPESQ